MFVQIVQSNGCASGQTCNDCIDSCTLAVGTPVVGPFEGGFSSTQDSVITGQFGVASGSEYMCYSEGGLDVATAEALCNYNTIVAESNTAAALPGEAGGNYYGLGPMRAKRAWCGEVPHQTPPNSCRTDPPPSRLSACRTC